MGWQFVYIDYNYCQWEIFDLSMVVRTVETKKKNMLFVTYIYIFKGPSSQQSVSWFWILDNSHLKNVYICILLFQIMQKIYRKPKILMIWCDSIEVNVGEQFL